VRQYLASILGIPFVLSLWTPFAIDFKGEPKVEVMGTALHISTDEAAGGFAYFLDKPIELSKEKNIKLSWSWTVPKFPNVTPTFPLEKDVEDFALRVGLLLSDGKSRIYLPRKFKKEVKKRIFALPYVLFYCATKLQPKGQKCVTLGNLGTVQDQLSLIFFSLLNSMGLSKK